MNSHQVLRAAALSLAAIGFLSLSACSHDQKDGKSPPTTAAGALLPRDTVVSLTAVTGYFPEVTKEASTGPNETSAGKPTGSRSVVFTSDDGNKKVTVSVDQYANAADASAAFETAVQGSEVAPGFKPATAPSLGQGAFAGTSQVGAEMHFGVGTRDGRLLVNLTHAGGIPVTPANSNNLSALAGAELAAAKQALGPSGSN